MHTHTQGSRLCEDFLGCQWKCFAICIDVNFGTSSIHKAQYLCGSNLRVGLRNRDRLRVRVLLRLRVRVWVRVWVRVRVRSRVRVRVRIRVGVGIRIRVRRSLRV